MRSYLSWIFSVGLAVFLLSGTPSDSSAAVRIAVVNVQRVLAQSNAGKAARADLEKEKARLEGSIKSKRANLEKLVREARDLQVEIEQKSAIWRDEERDRKTFELRNRRRTITRERDNLKRLVQESQRDLGDRQRSMVAHLIREIRDIVHAIGKEEKFEIIVDNAAGGVLYAASGVDITEKVIQRYNKQKKK